LACKLFELDNYSESPIDKVIALKFPVWYIPHSNKSFWILHQHRTAYDLWDTKYSDVRSMPDGERVRDLIRREDSKALGDSDNVYTISDTVSARLMSYSSISSEALYPPPRDMAKFHCSSYGNYFFFPSRINPLKRQEMVIQALAHCDSSIKVIFAGQADDSSYLDKLKKMALELGVDKNIEWIGYVSDEQKIEMYANCLMVIFTPYDEDYGYITPEAMLSSKGVITMIDSGGALEFVDTDINGLVVQNNPASLGDAMMAVFNNKALAQKYGESARLKIDKMNISWKKVLDRLL
jgi:glycosyltransferase involved in cell wall biosynthesis